MIAGRPHVEKDDLHGSLSFGMLRDSDVSAIELALEQVGPFGEVHLVVENGRLRFIRTVRSESVVGFAEAGRPSGGK